MSSPRISNPAVAGSNPAGVTIILLQAQCGRISGPRLRSGVRRSKWSTGPFRWPDGQPLLTLPESPAFAREACEGASTVARRAKVDLVAASFGWRAVTILLNQWASSFWNRLAMSRVGPPRGARPSTGDTLQQRSAPSGVGLSAMARQPCYG